MLAVVLALLACATSEPRVTWHAVVREGAEGCDNPAFVPTFEVDVGDAVASSITCCTVYEDGVTNCTTDPLGSVDGLTTAMCCDRTTVTWATLEVNEEE